MTTIGRRMAAQFLLGLTLAMSGLASAADKAFPDKPITFVVPFAAGGTTDVVARVIGRRMAELVGQPVVVENRPGAGGTIGIAQVARAPADGYTLVLVNAVQHTSSALLYRGLKYDAIKSFEPLAAIGSVRYLLLVNPSLGVSNYETFVKFARSKSGTLSYASSGVGSAPHLAMELFARAAGLQMLHVPYTGSGPAMNDLLAGHVQVAMDNVAAIPLIKTGRLKAIAITGDHRWDEFPEVPTFAEAGQKNFNVAGMFGFLLPAGTPSGVSDVLRRAIQNALNTPSVANVLAAQGLEVEYGDQDRFGAILRTESGRWSRLITEAGIALP